MRETNNRKDKQRNCPFEGFQGVGEVGKARNLSPHLDNNYTGKSICTAILELRV